MVTPLIATNIFWSPMFLSAAYRIAVSQGAHSLGFLFFAFLGSPRPAVTLKCKILPWFYTGFSTFFFGDGVWSGRFASAAFRVFTILALDLLWRAGVDLGMCDYRMYTGSA